MINFKDITTALYDLLVASNTEAKTYVITRNSAVNDNPNTATQGWIGIYRDGVDYAPHSSGPRPWLATIKIRVEIQSASMAGHEDCEDRLDEMESFVISAIESDRTLGGYVNIITGYSFDYSDAYNPDELEIYFQSSALIITAEVRA